MKYKGMIMPEVMVAMLLSGILCISVMNAASIMGKLGAMFRDGTGRVTSGIGAGICPVQDSVHMAGLDSLRKTIYDYESQKKSETEAW